MDTSNHSNSLSTPNLRWFLRQSAKISSLLQITMFPTKEMNNTFISIWNHLNPRSTRGRWYFMLNWVIPITRMEIFPKSRSLSKPCYNQSVVTLSESSYHLLIRSEDHFEVAYELLHYFPQAWPFRLKVGGSVCMHTALFSMFAEVRIHRTFNCPVDPKSWSNLCTGHLRTLSSEDWPRAVSIHLFTEWNSAIQMRRTFCSWFVLLCSLVNISAYAYLLRTARQWPALSCPKRWHYSPAFLVAGRKLPTGHCGVRNPLTTHSSGGF